MTNEEIKSKLIDIIVDKLNVDINEVKLASHFYNDLGADSLDTTELIMEFEKIFNIRISEEEANKIATVGDALHCLQEIINAQKSNIS